MARPKKKNVVFDLPAIDNQTERMIEGMGTNYGVVLIALRNPFYSFNAFTLCATLKQHDKTLPVAIVLDEYSRAQMNDEQVSMFDYIIQCKDEWTDGGKGYDPYYAKLNLDNITPFAKTLYLDSDIVWSPKKSPVQLINELSGVKFTSANRKREKIDGGSIGNHWAKLSDYHNIYGMEEIYDLSSEIMYFEKGTKVFETARKVYNENKMEVKKFGIGYPDEVYLSVAIEKEKVTLHKCPWLPLYWQPHYGSGIKKHDINFILDFYGLSLGGNMISKGIKDLSMHIKQDCFYRMKINTPPYYSFNKAQINSLKRQEL